MIKLTTDSIIGMLIGAVMTLGYTTIHFYLKCKRDKKSYENLLIKYINKINECNTLTTRNNILQKLYDEMIKEKNNETKRIN